MTGVPCPTCGSTRLLEALSRGELGEAAGTNPLVFACLAVLALWATASAGRWVLRLPAGRLRLRPGERWGIVMLVAASVAAGWAAMIVRGR
jgi:cytosine/uracil/thiamine/allantoin permease